ncbi:helix-turn-helix transcriptional regulator [Streptomyces kronopolitis]|uniref:helix-turn-helix transcriptional regulator n=1 Tax=Streptomyces kronopolitis TaxID=1612435 RepID=UPI003D96339E
MQPLGRGVTLAEHALRRDLALLARKVKVCAVFGHYARHHAETVRYAELVLAAGGEVRTTASLLPPLVVFDHSVAVLLGDEDEGGGHLVQHPAVVGFFARTVENAWASADVFQPAQGSSRLPDKLTDETKAAIVKLLAAGYKDEVVAKRLGIALRTCRKHIAEVFSELGARSRFQAGWLIRERAVEAEGA